MRTAKSFGHIKHHGLDGCMAMDSTHNGCLADLVEIDKYYTRSTDKLRTDETHRLIDCSALPRRLHAMVGLVYEKKT